MDAGTLAFVVMFGLAFGSFITLASYRLPRGEDVVRQGSRCPSCRTRLRARDLVPVFSWCASGGRCRACAARIHWRYPLIEIITAALFALIYARYGLSLTAVLLALSAVALMVMVVVDLEHYLIPDEAQSALLILGAAYLWAEGIAWQRGAVGLAVGLSAGLALRYGYYALRRREGLGLGDVKFLAVAGVWLGAHALVPFFFFSGILGVALALMWRAAGRGEVFPFGPALALALFACVVYPPLPESFWRFIEALYA